MKQLVIVVALTLSVVACGGNVGTTSSADAGSDTGGPPLPAPEKHRAIAQTCPPLAHTKPGIAPDPCAHDADCNKQPGGRCAPWGGGSTLGCFYDACAADVDCGSGKVCMCAADAKTGGNICIPGNCRIDADCGAKGFCSPTYGFDCGAFSGYQGFYCHTAGDTCRNDADCTAKGPGFCAYDTTAGHWTCGYAMCAG